MKKQKHLNEKNTSAKGGKEQVTLFSSVPHPRIKFSLDHIHFSKQTLLSSVCYRHGRMFSKQLNSRSGW